MTYWDWAVYVTLTDWTCSSNIVPIVWIGWAPSNHRWHFACSACLCWSISHCGKASAVREKWCGWLLWRRTLCCWFCWHVVLRCQERPKVFGIISLPSGISWKIQRYSTQIWDVFNKFAFTDKYTFTRYGLTPRRRYSFRLDLVSGRCWRCPVTTSLTIIAIGTHW